MLLIGLTACAQKTQQITIQVDNYTRLKMTDEYAFYETLIINPTTGDTSRVTMTPETWNLYTKKQSKAVFTLNPR